MSGAAPIAALLPPVPRVAPPAPVHTPSMRSHAPAGTAPFELDTLRLMPRPQRDAALDAEAAPVEETTVQPRLEVGPADDTYEREADQIAETVQRSVKDGDASAAPLSVQPKCSACESEDKIQRVGAAEKEAETGPASLAASPRTLASGGSPLAAPVRSFYESRLGRDLSAVRVHQGGQARAMNDSISARAFTYGSHIWLNAGERAAPSHTLSHEMAHVLQQTQPRALRDSAPGATPAGGTIQRLPGAARWVPSGTIFTRSAGASHDAVVKEVSAENAAVIAEAPIPNAGRKPPVDGITPTPGFADFFKAGANPDAIVGVRLAPGKSGASPSIATSLPPTAASDDDGAAAPDAAPPQPAPPAGQADPADPGGSSGGSGSATGGGGASGASARVANFNKFGVDGWGFSYGQKALKSGKAHPLVGNQHPRVVGTKKGASLTGTGKAPSQVRLGELKPGHNVGLREKGATGQLPRYQRKLSAVAGAVNATNARDGTWNLGSPALMDSDSDLTIPPKLKLGSTSKDFKRTLKLTAGLTRNRFRSAATVPGQLVFGRDPRPANAGVWTYIWVPQSPTLATGIAAGESAKIVALTAELDKLVNELTATPTRVTQPLRTARPQRRVSAHRVSRRVQRTKTHTDPFQARADAWERERKDDFKPKVDALVAEDLASPDGLQRAEAMADAYGSIAQELAGFNAPTLSSAQTSGLRDIRRMKRMASPLGGILGTLRKLFGAAFVKVANAFEKFKEKFHARVDQPRAAEEGGGLGGWKKVVVKLLVTALIEGVKLLAADIIHRFAACLQGMAVHLLKLLEAQLMVEFEDKIKEITDRIKSVTEGFEGVWQRIESEAEGWLAVFDKVDSMLADVKKFSDVLRDIEITVRGLMLVISCEAGFGFGCLVGALGQFAVPEFISWAAGTDRFKRAVINPIVKRVIAPLGKRAYHGLVNLMLGDATDDSVRGRIRNFASGVAACDLPSSTQILESSGFSGKYPAAETEAEQRKLLGELVGQYTREHAGEMRQKVKGRLRNPGGEPVSDDQVDGVAQALEDAKLTGEQAKEALTQAQGPDGRVDLSKLQQQIERQKSSGPAPPDAPKGGPGDPFLSIRKRIVIPGGGGTKPRIKVGPIDQPSGQNGPAVPGAGIKVEF